MFLLGSLAGVFSFVEASEARADSKKFALCSHQLRRNCVIDGDTFYLGKQKIRIADINAPETHEPKCAREAKLGARSSRRLMDLLNAGPFTLAHSGDRDHDKYGRKLRVVMRDGRSIGEQLVAEGLAHRWRGYKKSWCG